MRIRPDFNPPDIGQRVHVRVDENGVLIAADIRQQIVIEEPFPEFNQSIVLDCEVFAVDSKQVVLKCVDTIMLAELPGYS